METKSTSQGKLMLVTNIKRNHYKPCNRAEILNFSRNSLRKTKSRNQMLDTNIDNQNKAKSETKFSIPQAKGARQMKYVVKTKDLVTGEIDKTVKLCEKAKDLLVETIENSDEFEILEIIEVE